MLGKKDEGGRCTKTAREYAQKWMKLGEEGDHYKLVFGDEGTARGARNTIFVWDKLLGLKFFPTKWRRREMAFYATKLNKFGLPLDSRKTYTKLDWELWTATMGEKPEDFQRSWTRAPRGRMRQPDRVPLSDGMRPTPARNPASRRARWSADCSSRSCAIRRLWKKYASRDKTKLTGWAARIFSHDRSRRSSPPPTPSRRSGATRRSSRPADGWLPTTNDRVWQSRFGLGTEARPVRTSTPTWNTPDIYFASQIELPEASCTTALSCIHDEAAEIYINGVLAAKPRGFVAEYVTVPIRARALARRFRPGKNVIAIHLPPDDAGQYIDAGIVELEKAQMKSREPGSHSRARACNFASSLRRADRPQSEERLRSKGTATPERSREPQRRRGDGLRHRQDAAQRRRAGQDARLHRARHDRRLRGRVPEYYYGPMDGKERTWTKPREKERRDDRPRHATSTTSARAKT
jgi:hypothetical protein